MSNPLVSVVIPARNEESNIGKCLSSVIAQSYKNIEIIVVDDSSEDGTAQIVEEIQKRSDGIRLKLIRNSALKPGWTGKNHALSLGVASSEGDWILFLDADTELYPRALEDTLQLCISDEISMRSLSPEQTLVGFWERAIQPVVFEILSSLFDYGRISDPAEADAAANGQFIFISREAYQSTGGHASVSGKIVEDVELARNTKRAGFKISFGYGGRVVRCRMYKSLGEIVEGWTKGLFILAGLNFTKAARIIAGLALSLAPITLSAYFSAMFIGGARSWMNCIALSVSLAWAVAAYIRRRKGFGELNYPPSSATLHPIGVLFTIFLVARSAYLSAVSGKVRWKGRDYQAESKGDL